MSKQICNIFFIKLIGSLVMLLNFDYLYAQEIKELNHDNLTEYIELEVTKLNDAGGRLLKRQNRNSPQEIVIGQGGDTIKFVLKKSNDNGKKPVFQFLNAGNTAMGMNRICEDIVRQVMRPQNEIQRTAVDEEIAKSKINSYMEFCEKNQYSDVLKSEKLKCKVCMMQQCLNEKSNAFGTKHLKFCKILTSANEKQKPEIVRPATKQLPGPNQK